MSITKNIEKKLKKYSKKSGYEYTKLEEDIEELYDEYGSWNKSLKKLRGKIRRDSGSLVSSALTWEGFFFGETKVDFVEVLRNKALSLYNKPETREWAINQGYVTSDGTPLDPREKIGFRENENYMQPLKGHSYYRALFGVSKLQSEKGEHLFTKINFNGDFAQKDYGLEMFKYYKFRATQRSTDKNMYEQNATQVTEFKLSDKQLSKEEKEQMIRECGTKIWPVHKIEEAFITHQDPSNEDRTESGYPVLIEGDASRIYRDITGARNRRLILDNEHMWEQGVTVWMPSKMSLDFGEDSTIVVVGDIQKREFNNKQQLQVSGKGYFPILTFQRR